MSEDHKRWIERLEFYTKLKFYTKDLTIEKKKLVCDYVAWVKWKGDMEELEEIKKSIDLCQK